jgi:pimeloyl-ACP methyl ester carboxylesterase
MVATGLADKRSSGPEWTELADRCDYESINSSLAIAMGPELGRCIRMDDGEWARASGRVKGPYGSMPLIISAPAGETPIGRVVVELVGGPHGLLDDNAPGAWLEMRKALVKDGAAIVTLGYMGTSSRTSYPEADLPRAVDEVLFYASRLRKHFPQVPVTYVGVSAGGYLLAAASARLGDCHCVYVSPPLGAPSTVLELRRRTLGPAAFRAASDKPVTASLWAGSGETSRFAGRRRMRLEELFRNFFRGFETTSFATFVSRAEEGCSTLVYGEEDDRIGVELAPQAVRTAPGLQVVSVAGADHFFSSSDPSKRLAGAVYRAVSEDCRSPMKRRPKG